jgi:hypothetical protein
MVIIKNIRTGQQTTVSDEEAQRLKDSKYGRRFEFKEIVTPVEVKAVVEKKDSKK